MSTAKIKTFSDFQKSITVQKGDYSCGKNGIEIHYEYNGKELDLMPNVEQSCKLLETIGAIESHGFENDTHFVRVEVEAPDGQMKAVWIEYEQFLLSYSFSQSEAIGCAAWHEGEKLFQRIAKGGRAA